MAKCKTCLTEFERRSGAQRFCSLDCAKAAPKVKKMKRTAKKKKGRTVAQEAEAVAKRLQLLVRLKAADSEGYASCVTCGVRKHYKELQGGHFISRGKTFHKLREENVHPQCSGCNGPLRGNEVPYTLWMVDFYGREFVDWLESTKNNGMRWNRDELADLKADIERQIGEQEERLGIR